MLAEEGLSIDLLRAARTGVRLGGTVDAPAGTGILPVGHLARGAPRRAGHLAKNPDTGQVKYPTGYRETDAPRSGGLRTCTEAEEATIAATVDRIRATLHRVPKSYEGVAYRALVEEYLDVWSSNSCFGQGYCSGTVGKGVCYGGYKYAESTSELSFGPAFFSPGVSALLDPLDFQSGIVVHELVHMIDDHEDVPNGSCSQCGPECTAHEHRAAYVQARFMDISKCGAEMFGCSYGRADAGTPTEENLLETIGEFFECYLLEATLVEILALAALLLVNPAAAASVLLVGGAALAALLLVFLADAWF